MKSLKDFNQDLTWEIRLYVLVAVTTVALAHVWDAWSSSWVPLILTVIALVLFVEVYVVFIVRNPVLLRFLKWVIIIIGIALILVGNL